MIEVAVVATGACNLASMLAALRRVELQPHVVNSAAAIEFAERLVLPGVGAFGAVVKVLDTLGIRAALQRRIEAQRPTLAVCLGLQLLAEESEESPGARGLGAFAGRVERYAGELRVPQMGWNYVQPESACQFVTRGHAYFANSYCLKRPPAGWACASAHYGGAFVAALERGAVLACQFHPELSGDWGLELLRRWARSTGGVGC